MAATRTLKVKLVGDSRSAETMFSRVGAAASSFGRTAVRMGAVAAGGIAAAGTAAWSVANTYSDLNEAQSKANVLFGESNWMLDRFLSNARDSAGMSQRAALETASLFGPIFDQLDTGNLRVAQFSTEMAQLAGDMSSFFNVSADEASQALFAGLIGSSEPLQRFGVLLNAAAVEARALEMGLGDADGTISDAAKIQARYAIILEQTSNAQGDFARTSEGMANQQRRLGAVWEDVRAQLGEGFAPIFANLLESMADNLPAVSGFVQDVVEGDWKAVWGRFKTVAEEQWNATLKPWLTRLKDEAPGAIANAAVWLYDSGKDMMMGLWRGAKDLWGGLIWPWMQRRGELIWTALEPFIEEGYEKGRELLDRFWTGLKELWESIKTWFNGLSFEWSRLLPEWLRDPDWDWGRLYPDFLPGGGGGSAPSGVGIDETGSLAEYFRTTGSGETFYDPATGEHVYGSVIYNRYYLDPSAGVNSDATREAARAGFGPYGGLGAGAFAPSG